ncbi:MAG: Ig-like domain-containing protein [Eubacteriales bacterium]|nr:Ig-like domain-containing protein [Eubacteriales bacterium]
MREKLYNRLLTGLLFILIVFSVLGLTHTLKANASTATTATEVATTTKKAKPKLAVTSIGLAKGKTYQLKLLNASGTIKWSSSNKKVAKVNSKGKVTALHHGTVKIKAVYKKKTYTCKVKVISLNYTQATIGVGKKLSLKVKNGKNTKWSSSNTKIATVSSKGTVKALKSGKVTITCKSNSGKIKCTVYIPQIVVKSEKIAVNRKGTLQISNTGNACKWSSSLKSVATVDKNGVVTGLKAGTVTITCKTGLATLTYKLEIVDPLDIVTQRSSLPYPTTRSNQPPSISVKINSFPEERTYTIFRQNSSENLISQYPSFMPWHGCSASALTTVLTAYAGYTGTPADMIMNLEKQVFGEDAWKKNYDKYSSSSSLDLSRPISQYGMTQVLTRKGVKHRYVRTFTKEEAKVEIEDHLKTGNPIIFVASASDGKSTKFTTSYHTMVMLGMTETDQVIIADSVDRTKENFGYDTRIKYSTINEIINFIFACTNPTSTSKYWNGREGCGGYILINPM